MMSAAGVAVKAANGTLFRRTYPGDPSQVGRVRLDIAEVVAGCPVADELTLVTSELSANAVVHSRSGRLGGRFTVVANTSPRQFAWIEVLDQGGQWDCRHNQDDRPHGLDIVRAIAGDGNWGIAGNGATGRVVWARIDWSDNPAAGRTLG